MQKLLIIRKNVLVVVLLSLSFSNCKHEYTPVPQTIAGSDYAGEWNGVTTVTRALTGTAILETSVPLVEIMSLRQENGKDTVNFKDPATGANIAGREGTWSVTQVTNTEDRNLDGAKLLRLRVVTTANRVTYTNYTIIGAPGKTLVLNNGASKTLTYTK